MAKLEKKLVFRLSKDDFNALLSIARSHDCKISFVIRRVLSMYLKGVENSRRFVPKPEDFKDKV